MVSPLVVTLIFTSINHFFEQHIWSWLRWNQSFPEGQGLPKTWLPCFLIITTYLGRIFVLASNILTHFLSFCIRFCSFIAFGCVKSKSDVNCVFIFWKIGSCTVTCARRAILSDAAEENALLVKLSVDIQNEWLCYATVALFPRFIQNISKCRVYFMIGPMFTLNN